MTTNQDDAISIMMEEGQKTTTLASQLVVDDEVGGNIATPYHSVSDEHNNNNDVVLLTLPIEAKLCATFILVTFFVINSILLGMEYTNGWQFNKSRYIEMAYYLIFIPLPIIIFIMTLRWKIYASDEEILYQHGLWFCCCNIDGRERISTKDIKEVKIIYQPMENDNGFRTKYYTETTIKIYTTTTATAINIKKDDEVLIEEDGIINNTTSSTSPQGTMTTTPPMTTRPDMEICHSDLTFLRPFLTWLQVRSRSSSSNSSQHNHHHHHQFILQEETLPSMYIYHRE